MIARSPWSLVRPGVMPGSAGCSGAVVDRPGSGRPAPRSARQPGTNNSEDPLDPTNPTSYSLLQESLEDTTNLSIQSTVGIGGGG
jgi:hypothetical protein